MFRDREDAGRQLAARLHDYRLRDPLVLAIPRGGVVVGATLARRLGAELDVVLARKLRHPWSSEFALGAVAESGEIVLNASQMEGLESFTEYLKEERRRQQEEIDRRRTLFRSVRPTASVAGRSVIVTDDGMATGSTMMAALRVVNAKRPFEVIVAIPVGSPDRLEEVKGECDEMVCLLKAADLMSVGEFYEDFKQVEDKEVVGILREFATRRQSHPENMSFGKA